MAKKATVKKEKVVKDKASFVDPFAPGVTYTDFVKALGNTAPKDYLKGKCTEDQIQWIEGELKQFKNKK